MAGLAKIRMPYTPEPSAGDVRELPLYSLAEVAYFLKVPKPTLHRWTRPGFSRRRGKLEPLIIAADYDAALLSFYNLNEAHILSVTTRVHGVKFGAIRRAMETLRGSTGVNSRHPLLSREFYTDGQDLFIKTIESRINVSQFGQLGLREVLDSYLRLIERDSDFNPNKLYPAHQPVPKVVAILPTVSSGRPVIDGTGIPVAAVWNRYKAGDSVENLADDYEIPESQIEGAIGYFERLKPAA